MTSTSFQDLSISTLQAEKWTKQHFNIEATAQKLAGEVDFNFYLKTKNNTSYTLKISRPNVSKEDVEFQASILQHLENANLPYQIPQLIPTSDGRLFKKILDENKQERWIRLQKWLEGRMLAKVHPRSPKLLESWGEVAGQLAFALQGFDHPHAHRFYKWNPSETLYAKKYQTYIQGLEEQEIAQYFWAHFEKETRPKLSKLRKSINYNDAHEHNLLVNNDWANPRIIGVIDFGDALFTHTINELAIACAYACMGAIDPLEAATHVIKGFHRIFPLEEKEVEVLFSLIAARLMITVANAAWNKQHEPDNVYLLVSEKPAWALLKKWRKISPAFAHYTFRSACAWEAYPKAVIFQNWITSQKGGMVAPIDFTHKKTTPLDLSVGSLDLGNNSNFENIKKFQQSINRLLEDKEAEIGYGGYAEVRPFYTTDAYQTEGNAGAQWRTVHLGMDFWANAETVVLAPLDGMVHSFANNKGDCDYGPTIILRHKITEQLTFYTLYGHLTLDSLNNLQIGKLIKKGQPLAKIGAPPANGNWPPHLHFQIMLDTLGNRGDFPGVAYPHEKEVYLSICPDPSCFIAHLPFSKPTEQKSIEDILKFRHHHLGKNLSVSYQNPLQMVRGYRQYLYDVTARRYLDTVNNVAHVGHEHPRVVRVAQRQMALLNTNTRYLHNNIIHFAEELLATFSAELSVVYFVNSGSEANELAIRMAKTYTGQKDMLAIAVGYHGNTGGCIDISSYKFDGKGGNGAPPYTHIIPIPDVYRGLHRNPQKAGQQYADYASRAIKKMQKAGRNPAAFIAESILSCGGQILLPDGYLKSIYQEVRAAGGLCIADEVQVGFGRVAEKFWAFELQGVVPDIVTLGKPMGNGHPLAAVVTTQKVAEAFANGMEYFNTFGGNPVSCAIGREVLKVMQEEQLQQNAKEVGEYLKKELQNLQTPYPIIGDVRGVGFFLGFELVNNAETLAPAAQEAAYLSNRMRERGILMSTDGPFHNVLKIKPPMCFNKSNVDFFVENLDEVLKEDFLSVMTKK